MAIKISAPNEGSAPVTLREVTSETVIQICELSETLTPQQQKAVAPNAVSIAEAHFCEKAWFRAIYAGEEPVGFLMIRDDPETPEYYLWRLMIARPYQGKGYGEQAVRLLIEYIKSRPNPTELLVSCITGEGSPEGFYQRLGFVNTGRMDEDEIVLSLKL